MSGGAGGGGGSNGADGYSGSSGGSGGNGGGGGSNFVAEDGGYGGYGLAGGVGGRGADGGNGGSGGGGIRLFVRGSLAIDGTLSTSGAAGQSGGAGGTAGLGNVVRGATTNGQTGEARGDARPYSIGGTDFGTQYTSTAGGNGGNGGAGAPGQRGGNGGRGADGMDGSLQIIASSITGVGPIQAGATINSFGGRAVASQTYLSSGSYNKYRSDDEQDYLAAGQPYGTLSPNVPQLVGGADTYGILQGNDGNADTAFTNLPRNQSYQKGAIAQIRRVANGTGVFSYAPGLEALTKFDTLAISNLTTGGLVTPTLAINATNTGRSVTAAALGVRGIANNPDFTPGATGTQTLASLGAKNTWVTEIVHGKAYDVTVGLKLYNNVRTYTLSGTNPNSILIIDTGLPTFTVTSSNAPGAKSATLGALDGIDKSARFTAYYRVGSGVQTATVSMQNLGSAFSFTTGTIASPTALPVGDYGNVYYSVGINPQQTQTATFNYQGDDSQPTGTSTQQYNFTGEYGVGNATMYMVVRNVAPQFAASNNDRTFDAAATKTIDVIASNLLGGTDGIAAGKLGAIDILSYRFNGGDAALFSAGTFSDTELLALEEGHVNVTLNTTTPGTYSTFLIVNTDVGANVGQAGQSYAVPINVTVTPEPAVLSLAAVGLLFGLRRRTTAAI